MKTPASRLDPARVTSAGTAAVEESASTAPAGNASTTNVAPSRRRSSTFPSRPVQPTCSPGDAIQQRLNRLKDNLIQGEKKLDALQEQGVAVIDQKTYVSTLEAVIADLAEFSDHGRLGKVLPQAMASLAQRLWQRFPQATHTYVMVGNSPAGLMAFLQLNEPDADVVHLPVGGIASPVFNAADACHVDLVRKVIDDYLGHALRRAMADGKTLVLIDLVSSGVTIELLEKLVGGWLDVHAGKNRRLAVFGYGRVMPAQWLGRTNDGPAGRCARAFVVPSGKSERAFIHMSEAKIIKNVMHLKSAESVTFQLVGNQADAKIEAVTVGHPANLKRTRDLLVAWQGANPAPSMPAGEQGWEVVD